MKISRKVMVGLLAASLILLSVAAVVAWRGSADQRSMAGPATEMSAIATRGNLEVIVSGSGTLQSEVREDVRVPLSGSLVRFDLEAGRKVSAGDILAKLDVQDMELQIERKRLDIEIQERELQKLREEETEAVLTATESGLIDWSVRDGDRVQSGSGIATVTDRDYLEVTGRFSSAGVAGIVKGQTAAFPTEAAESALHLVPAAPADCLVRNNPDADAPPPMKFGCITVNRLFPQSAFPRRP
ncbi:MAG: hypothetical protein M1552_00985 [Firmicutes bacterium]|nr:hypothetical protein [Bacillota bacterium]